MLRQQATGVSKCDNSTDAIRIDVDCNWIANLKFIKSVDEVVDFCEVLSTNGFIVTPICDGLVRQPSK